jgi:hypothetical protein
MKVIGAGFGRTGTESTQAALERLLHGKCYHMKEVVNNPSHLDRWYEFALSGRKNMDWKALLQDYVACVDWPTCNYYKELIEVFPDAKVLLTYREPEKWFPSYLTLIRVSGLMNRFAFLVPMFRKFRTVTDNAVWNIFSDRRDRAHCIAVYNQHIESVKASVPPDRLLVFEVQQGWEPLCKFLEVDVPEEPFPHLNRRADIQKYAGRLIAGRVLRQTTVPLFVIGGIILAAYLLF